MTTESQSQRKDHLVITAILVCWWLVVGAFLVGIIADVSQREGVITATVTLAVVVTIILSTWYRVTWTQGVTDGRSRRL